MRDIEGLVRPIFGLCVHVEDGLQRFAGIKTLLMRPIFVSSCVSSD